MSDIDVIGLYQRITHRALRLESRQRYAVPWEKEGLAAWRRGEPEPTTPQRERTMETLEDADRLWRELGQPGWDRFGLTATTERQWIWLDSPNGAHTWPLTSPAR
jgi:hypothetical protein